AGMSAGRGRDRAAGRAEVTRAADVVAAPPPGAHPACAHRCPTLAISSPGAIGSEQTSHVVGYLAVSGTRPPYEARQAGQPNRRQPSFATTSRANAAIPSPFGWIG